MEIFENLDKIKNTLKSGRPIELDTSEAYYIKGIKSGENLMYIFKNCKDGSTYNLKFDLEKNSICWWHNYQNSQENINLSEGELKKVSDENYGFFTFTKDKNGKIQTKQGIIEVPTIGNIEYLIEQTDLELAKLLKVVYPNKRIIPENSNIEYYKQEDEIIEEAYEENIRRDESDENGLLEQIRKIQSEIETLQFKKQKLEAKLKSKGLEEKKESISI